MIAIKEMKMPKCCHWDCPLAREDGGACMIDAYDSKTDTKKKRASDCPLVEIVTCKDCKYWVTDDGTPYCGNFCGMTNENDYCSWAERRE